jgi:hypothetical protein
MRISSQTTRENIRRLRDALYHPAVRLREPEQIRLINELGRTTGPEAVPVLLSVVFAGVGPSATAAAGSIEQIVRTCTNFELVQLDRMLRERGDWQWHSVNPSDVARLSHGLTGVLGAIASHRSGHVREAAIRLLASIDDGGELPFLLIRVNDWVPQVRDAAKQAVLARVHSDYAAHFARHLPLIRRLQFQKREDHGDVLVPILHLMRSASSHAVLLAALEESDRVARRFAFELLAEAVGNPADLIAHGLASEDEVIRLRAARLARERLAGEELESALARLLADRFMPVRREAVYGYVERLPQAAPGVLRRSLLDGHVSMRELARFHLRQQGESDFAAFYRSKLGQAAGRERAAAIAGLGETGSAEDVGHVELFLSDPDPHVRRAAVRALGRLDADGRSLERFLIALDDGSAAVAKAAREALRSRVYLLSPPRLWSIFTATTHRHTRRAVLSLVAALSWWDSAPLLVAAAGTDDVEVRRDALAYLDRWSRNSNRLSVRPTREQLMLLGQATQQHRASLNHRSLTDIETHLASGKRAWA